MENFPFSVMHQPDVNGVCVFLAQHGYKEDITHRAYYSAYSRIPLHRFEAPDEKLNVLID